MPTTVVLGETDEGKAQLHGNELELFDTNPPSQPDPVAIRLRSANGGIAKISFDRPDGHGGWTETGYIFGKRDERPGLHDKIIFEFWQSGSHDGDAAKLMEIRHDGVWMVGQQPLAGAQQDRLVSANGRFCLAMQSDGNLVIYRRDPSDGHLHSPTWASGTAE